ncbi:hypothetical protein CASFOL_020144 [Castilleja foliolosa]|uniref:Homeobox domain-containing protein n=1 Tax=Castilleja foliolosa TaxID=1961234 RepID=A0ABD3D475_9LAMI
MAGSGGDDEKSRHIIASAAYNSYPDASSNLAAHLQSLGPTGPDIYTLSTGSAMENMIGFPPKNHHHHQQHDIQNGAVSSWKGFSVRPASGPSQKQIIDGHETELINYQHDLTEFLDADDSVNDPSSSLRSSCVFTCEGLERPSHGLSLSLNFSHPSSIGLQSFELRQQQQDDFIRFGPSSSRSVNNNNNNQQFHAYIIRHSKYLGPAQELLVEFCNLGSNRNNNNTKTKAIQKDNEINVINKQSIYSLDLVELQRRKNKLLHMLEEVDRRYKHYCDQMKAVVSPFESLVGPGAATTYSALASKAMSRHFRCLKDGIVSQLKAVKKAMGEKDSALGAPGAVKGETPRLRLLDQTLRQQRALQQLSNMEIHPWRPQRGLPERSVSVLRAWLFEHFLHPYPSDVDKHILSRQTGLSRSQVSNWFINARVRLWKPMVEEMYLEELKEDQNPNDAVFSVEENDGPQNPNFPDQKPTRLESECLSSIIINNPDKNDVGKNKAIQNPSFGRIGDSFGAVEFELPSYGNHPGGGGGVSLTSLTLGLHHHGGASGSGGGVNLAFPAAAAAVQGSVFYNRDHNQIEDCETVPYSLLDGEAQNLQYRNLMGSQLLHDFG